MRDNRLANVLMALVISILCLQGAMAEIYTWKDASGKVHFSDTKPEGAQAESVDIRVNTIIAPSVSDSDFLNTRELSTGESGQVVMYSAEWCGVCKQARRYFNQQGIAFREYDIETSRKGRRDYDRLNGRGVPIILVGDKRLDGFNVARFESLYNGNKGR